MSVPSEARVLVLEPDAYVSGIGAVTEGLQALTHLAHIRIDGQIRRAYVKCFPDEHHHGLCNEVLAHVLGYYLGLPQPRGAILIVPHDLLQAHHPATTFSTGNVACWASIEAHTPSNAKHGMAKVIFQGDDLQMLAALEQWPNYPMLLAFDHWIANADRNTGNIMMVGPRAFVAIDHSAAFTGPSWVWTQLDPAKDFVNQLMDGHIRLKGLELPLKSAILKEADELLGAYVRAMDEFDYWRAQLPLSDFLALGNFVLRRAFEAPANLRAKTQMVA